MLLILEYYSNGAERMTFESNGYIGIRTTTPSTFLHYSNFYTINDFQTMWDVTNVDDAVGRAQTSDVSNGTRVWMGSTNYNGSALAGSNNARISIEYDYNSVQEVLVLWVLEITGFVGFTVHYFILYIRLGRIF